MKQEFIFLILLILIFSGAMIHTLLYGKKAFKKPEIYVLGISLVFYGYFVLNSLLNHSKKGFFFHLHDIDFANYLLFFVSIVNALLLFKTLKAQRQAIRDQDKASRISAFENRFFKFIDYHRDNVTHLGYRKPDTHEKEFWQGIQVFNIIHFEVTDLIAAIIKSVNPSLDTIQQKADIVNFAYQCVFYGTGKRDAIHVLKAHFKDKESYFQDVKFGEESLEQRTAAYSKDQVYYTGHVNRLGRYFRNIYQAIKYVESQDFLSENEKYDYVKHLRAQFSSYEQVIFFYNSLSDLGRTWEFGKYSRQNPSTVDERKKCYNDLLITKYDLIRNTIFNYNKGNIVICDKEKDGISFEISLKDFYPLLTLESEDECHVNGVLPFTKNGLNICRFCFNENYIGYANDAAEAKIIECFTKEQYDKDRADKKVFKCDEEDCKSMKTIKGKTSYKA